MRILVIGTGVIGTTYAWQLSGIGCELTHYVRKGKKDFYEKEGIEIECLDTRHSKSTENRVHYMPKFIDNPKLLSEYDLILVSVGSDQLVPVLELLKENSQGVDVFFLQNIRPGEEKFIEQYLKPTQYFFGYPFKAGGGKEDNVIRCVIFGNSFTNTMLGEKDGRKSERLNKIYTLIKTAKLNPKVTTKIIPYIRCHYVWAATILGAYAKAGTYEKLVCNKEIMRQLYIGMREAFETCRAESINPARIAPTSYYYFPLFLLVPFSQKLFDSEDMKRMFEGHVSGSPEEMETMYYDILEAGEKYGIDMPVYKSFKDSFDRLLNI
ncbi:MAG TPA: 2-dehydropantoate 2-reductase N-terminal domain-containing protein [Pseudobacteroides sp.]|uniref:ketopantoate reductase family protein n=1 Tax=Pseudobacteroides sp. TaxID=1968840 RepID=UPI002F9347D6